METSEIKTAETTSEEYLQASMIKISVRSDELKGKLSVSQSCDFEKSTARINEKFKGKVASRLSENKGSIPALIL